MDKFDSFKRSEVMARIRSKNTKPEVKLRSALFSQGYRFRLHRSDLPGKPDIVLPKFKTVIFVHGCFWHLHDNCRDGVIPKSRKEYWEPKLTKNVTRDSHNEKELKARGWNVIVIWECEIEKNIQKVLKAVQSYLPNR